MIDIEAGVTWAIDIANDDSHGYSQPNRMSGIDFDCSSLVGSALSMMGFTAYPSDWYPSTRTMKAYIEGCGWVWHDGIGGVHRGCVLWKTGHTALAISDRQLVEAIRSEHHTITGSYGDQDGQEIRIADIGYTTWTGYWYYPKEDEVTEQDYNEIAERVWSFRIQGTQARDRLYGLDAIQVPAIQSTLDDTTDPTGRDMNLTTHQHVKYIAAAVTDIKEKLERLLNDITGTETV